MDTCHVAPNWYRTRIPKFHFEILFFKWRRASENFDCYPKMGKQILFKLFGACASGECHFLFFKAKSRVKLNFISSEIKLIKMYLIRTFSKMAKCGKSLHPTAQYTAPIGSNGSRVILTSSCSDFPYSPTRPTVRLKRGGFSKSCLYNYNMCRL